jgi:hypothetical protein
MINKRLERQKIERLLPWHAAGTLSRREADLVERAPIEALRTLEQLAHRRRLLGIRFLKRKLLAKSP